MEYDEREKDGKLFSMTYMINKITILTRGFT